MPTPQEIKAEFWKSLVSDRIVMLGLDGLEDGYTQPMAAQIADEKSPGPIWFFLTRTNTLIEKMQKTSSAIAAFSSKGQDVYATISGTLTIEANRNRIDDLWNPEAEAWFEGKTDPELQLIRMDLGRGRIWLDQSSLIAGAKRVVGLGDPKEDYKKNVAEVDFQ